MNIRRILRLSWLSVAALFWASCGDDSNSQAPVPESEVPDPESSADDAVTSSSSSEVTVSSSKEESSSSSEAGPESSATLVSSSSEASSSSYGGYVLASNPSVTCEDFYKDAGRICNTYYTCEDYQKYLGSDTTIAESLLMQWEDKLENCGAVEGPVALYGVMYRASEFCGEYVQFGGFKCSNDSIYGPNDFVFGEDKVLYRTIEEYDAAHGISSSSIAQSSSSSAQPETLIQNCPQDGFALFADILADVQKELYERIAAKYEDTENPLTDVEKDYYEGILDHENKKLKGPLAPYIDRENVDVMVESLEDYSDYWFDGYIAKSETCAEGTTVLRERYQEKYKEILEESLEKIEYGLRTYRARNR